MSAEDRERESSQDGFEVIVKNEGARRGHRKEIALFFLPCESCG